MHQFPLIREYKRELPKSIRSVEIDRSKGSYEKAIETQTDKLNERYDNNNDKKKKKSRSRTVKVAEL